MALADFQDIIDGLVQDTALILEENARDQAIEFARIRYSQDRPYLIYREVTADGTQILPLPVDWEANLSHLVMLEYPIDNVPPTLWPLDDFCLHQTVGGQKIHLTSAIPTGEAVYLGFTTSHSLDISIDTIPEQDREAVSKWAAAILCDQLSNHFAGFSEPTLQADTVDFNSKSRDYSSQARAYRKAYFDQLGIDPKRSVAAGVVVDLDLNDSRGRDRVIHRRGLR